MRPSQDKPRQAEPKHVEKGLAKSKAWAQTVDITVNGKIARALVDTGAEVNVRPRRQQRGSGCDILQATPKSELLTLHRLL